MTGYFVKLTCLCSFLYTLGSLTSAAAGLVTPRMLAKACDSERPQEQGYCMGYIVGVGEVITQELGYRDDLPPVCVPDMLSAQDGYTETLARMKSDWTKSGRSTHQDRVRATVERAWALAYPCLPSDSGTRPRQDYFLDGLDLRSWCADKKIRLRGQCQGYLVAIFERLTTVEARDTAEGQAQNYGCLPTGETGKYLSRKGMRQIADIDAESHLFAWLGDSGIDLVQRSVETLWSRVPGSCHLRVLRGP